MVKPLVCRPFEKARRVFLFLSLLINFFQINPKTINAEIIQNIQSIAEKDEKYQNDKWKLYSDEKLDEGIIRSSTTLQNAQNLSTVEAYVPPEWHILDHDSKLKLVEMLSWENLRRWNFDIFGLTKLSKGRPLLFLGWAILASPYAQLALQDFFLNETDQRIPVRKKQMKGYYFSDEFSIPQKLIIDFLRTFEDGYNRDNPYHNNMHAADVLQTSHSFLQSMGGSSKFVSSINLFSILISTIVHDVGHPGLNNRFQINTQSQLALDYNNKSVLENFHINRTFEILNEGGPKINIFQAMKTKDYLKCKDTLINIVLGTDMDLHFKLFQQAETLSNFSLGWEEKDVLSFATFLVHIADISNGAKPFARSMKWTDLVLEEFFRQGDKERDMGLPISPLCDRRSTSRSKSQIGFINYFVKPIYLALSKHMPRVVKEILPIINNNINEWQRIIDEEENEKENNKLHSSEL